MLMTLIKAYDIEYMGKLKVRIKILLGTFFAKHLHTASVQTFFKKNNNKTFTIPSAGPGQPRWHKITDCHRNRCIFSTVPQLLTSLSPQMKRDNVVKL